MKNISKGKTFKPEQVMPIKENQTISKKLLDLCDCHILLMSLDQNTDISLEFYADEIIYLVLKGEININNEKLINNELILFEENRIFDIGARDKR
ncbi:hypothetical protein [Finegoldia magna]|uniref:hypothetical protein n=1 Tax=Finegoldia magna TaxID=1260 RepID=UPI0026F12ACD|nr:hypothetical protein [Finegoldia magna]